jgi:hypothetical protein
MIVLQILVSLFVLIVLAKLFKQYNGDKITLANFLLWCLLWLAVLLVFWQPDLTSYLANFLGIGRGADLIIYVAILVLVYLVFRVFVRLQKLEKDLTKLIRDEAIKNASKR